MFIESNGLKINKSLEFEPESGLGSRKKINAPDCAVFWFVCKAHPPVHISGYVLVDATQQTDQRTSQMVYLFFAEALSRSD